MKTIKTSLLLAGVALGLPLMAADQAPGVPAKDTPVATAATNAVAPPAQAAVAGTNTATVATTVTNGGNGLHLNFHNAPLNLVLDYFADAAGFVINKEADVRGTVDVWSKEPVTKDEAVEILNSQLKKNHYAVTRSGRILTIVSLEEAKTADTDIVSGNKWEEVEKGDVVETRIIPVRYADASQLVANLQVLLPTSAMLSVNQSANSLILVATRTDIRRMLKIVSALDTSIASVSSIKVFPLRYADAKQLANTVQQLFSPQGAQGPGGLRAQLFNMFRGGGGGPFGGPGGPAGVNAAGAAGGGAASKVVAAADDYSNSLIVSAAPDLMATIADMVQQIDQPSTDITEVRVFQLVNADPLDLADQLAQLFPDDTRSGTDQNQNARFRFFGGRFGGGNNEAATTDRMKKKGRVLAVPDPRTSSLVVSAASELMPQIAQMIEKLDSIKAGGRVVKVIDLRNADPQDVYQTLQDLFNKNNTMRANTPNSRSMLGQGNPLTSRATQQQQTGPGTTGGIGTGRNTGALGGGGF